MNTVFCQHFKEDLPAMSEPPFETDLGREIQSKLSQKAYDEWMERQTMIINENRLNLMNASHQELVKGYLMDFMEGNEVDLPKDYVEV